MDDNGLYGWGSAVLFGTGIVTGFYLKRFFGGGGVGGTMEYAKAMADNIKKKGKQVKAISRALARGGSTHKMVFVVRTDLNMGKGKIAAQCSHAAVYCYQRAIVETPDDLNIWDATGCVKICLKGDGDEKSLMALLKKAEDLKIVTGLVRDAGHTQVASGTVTVLGLGPAPATEIDKVTGHLKLM